eukprot:74405_1
MAEQPSAQEIKVIKQAISRMRDADKSSDIAYHNALKDNAQTNQELSAMAKDIDKLMERVNQIGNRLADPHQRSQNISNRKEERLQKRIQRQAEKTKQLIEYWSKKYIEHIETNHIDNEDMRKEDDSLQQIEAKLIKYGVNTDHLFEKRRVSSIEDIQSEPDDEKQLHVSDTESGENEPKQHKTLRKQQKEKDNQRKLRSRKRTTKSRGSSKRGSKRSTNQQKRKERSDKDKHNQFYYICKVSIVCGFVLLFVGYCVM